MGGGEGWDQQRDEEDPGGEGRTPGNGPGCLDENDTAKEETHETVIEPGAESEKDRADPEAGGIAALGETQCGVLRTLHQHY